MVCANSTGTAMTINCNHQVPIRLPPFLNRLVHHLLQLIAVPFFYKGVLNDLSHDSTFSSDEDIGKIHILLNTGTLQRLNSELSSLPQQVLA